MQEILSLLQSNELGIVGIGSGLGGIVLAWIFKKIPNDKIKKVVGKFMLGLGIGVTLGLSKWPPMAPFWNKIVEPWVIDFIDNVLIEGLKKFVEGLRTDKQK